MKNSFAYHRTVKFVSSRHNLTLLVPTFFCRFHHLQKVGCNSTDFGYTMHQMKDIVHAYLQVEFFFEFISEKVEKYVFENPIFEVCVEKHSPSVVKGLRLRPLMPWKFAILIVSEC